MLRGLVGGFAVLACAALASGGQFNRILDIGDPAPEWSALPGTDGKTHDAKSLAGAPVVVVVFTCNSCPYAVDAEERIVQLHADYAAKNVAVVAINVNLVEEDRLPAMKEKVEANGWKFPYLFDESQQIAKEFGAKYTPEVYVLDRERKVAYMGSMDDSPDGKNVTKTYVRDAIDAVLEGRDVATAETVPVGCRIRMSRRR
ncbi:thiol-disulfide oxidoreductase [Roseimaritima multifibrata]|uniref:Thiol-disulfide oxidoreductase n=1 Tax=Roseimaritima multifibrata TaxID=1930274 RepID=A0A517MCH9_9BACT|nr:thioredoxin family protein [Roseimaritima multifibrata]QDS92536.1 thiol-disulfide oxidoreductase [Roseimaritima multifibrata]